MSRPSKLIENPRPLPHRIEHRVLVRDIQQVVADYYRVSLIDMLGERRFRAIARPRQVAMFLCQQHTSRSYPDIGRRFGGRDHTTVLHAVRVIEQLYSTDPAMERDIRLLTNQIANWNRRTENAIATAERRIETLTARVEMLRAVTSERAAA